MDRPRWADSASDRLESTQRLSMRATLRMNVHSNVAPCAGPHGELPTECPGWCEYADPVQLPRVGPTWVAEGSTIGGRYMLRHLLGHGGMGLVYSAIDRRSDQVVAVKVLRPGLAHTASSVGRFITEARAMARISHPNVVRVLDAGVHGRLPYLAMEFIEGRSLEVLLRHTWRGLLPLPRARDVLDAIARGVAAIHNAGVVHNDLKPGNVFVDVSGRIVVGDLGMARPHGPACRRRAGEVVGTPSFMAPEQSDGSTRATTPATDVYALGVLGFELFTGRLPFTEDDYTKVLEAHHSKPPPRPSSLRPEIPVALDAVLLQALAKRPDDRPPDASALRRALARTENDLTPASASV